MRAGRSRWRLSLGGFSSGFIHRAVGYHVLAGWPLLAAGARLVTAYLAYQESRRLQVCAPVADVTVRAVQPRHQNSISSTGGSNP